MIRRLLLVGVIVAGLSMPVQASAVTPGVFTSPAEIAFLPTSGKAWDAMKAAAYKAWTTPTIAKQDSTDDTNTLAGALVATRTNDEVLRVKVRTQVMRLVASHPYDRVLAAARQLPSYIIAADLVGLSGSDRTLFEAFLREAATHKMSGHSGGTDLRTTALLSPNNWGTMARAAMAAIQVYTNDPVGLAETGRAHLAWLGGPVDRLKYTSTNWHTATPKVGVNPRGATRNGNNLDGVQPEDQRRTGSYTWPAPKGSYPWEALQGSVLAGVILDRAGVVPFQAGDDALVRAAAWLTGPNANPASGDDRNTPFMVARYTGGTATGTTTAAKNIAWCDWILG